ncbi:hypothetical protein [Rubritalea tangerina]|uniref:hypothetical protein n=1 Tax=Rubritalea tangerina TaxID=430798 RepID=UPI00360A101A
MARRPYQLRLSTENTSRRPLLLELDHFFLRPQSIDQLGYPSVFPSIYRQMNPKFFRVNVTEPRRNRRYSFDLI